MIYFSSLVISVLSLSFAFVWKKTKNSTKERVAGDAYRWSICRGIDSLRARLAQRYLFTHTRICCVIEDPIAGAHWKAIY